MQKTLFTLFAILVSSSTSTSAYPQSLAPVDAVQKSEESSSIQQLVEEHEARMEQIRQTGGGIVSEETEASSAEAFDQDGNDRPMTPDEEAVTKILGFRANLQVALDPALLAGRNPELQPATRWIVLERMLDGVAIGCAAARDGDAFTITPLSGPDQGNPIVGSVYAFVTEIQGFGQLRTTCTVSYDGLAVKHQAVGFTDIDDQSTWTNPSYASSEK